MSQAPSSVIYLPPGVLPQVAPPAGVPTSGIPFDRAFFEKLLPQAVQSFCSQVKCDLPVVEVYTMDGTRHFVNGISGVTDTFVALQTSLEDHDHTVQAFIPYQTIYRVEIHPEGDSNRGRLGFALDAKTPPAIQAAAEPAAEPAAERPAASKARKKRGARG